MSNRWEYMVVDWSYSTTGQGTNLQRTWKGEFSIDRPGHEPEIRPSYDSTNKQAETTFIGELLNEVGAEGWEVVSETVLDTTIITDSRGWLESGVPTQVRWLLKRRIDH